MNEREYQDYRGEDYKMGIIDEFIQDNYAYRRLFYDHKLCALIQKTRYGFPEIVLINPNFDYDTTIKYTETFCGMICGGFTETKNIIKLGSREELSKVLAEYKALNLKIEEIKNSHHY